MNTLEMITQRVKEKPIPSLVAFQILKLIEDENHSLKDVVRLVENDASLTSEVLKMANSAAYYRGSPVTTINRALLLMGEMMVVGVAICASSSIVFHSPLEGYDSQTGEMWDHSLRTAIATREIAKYARQTISQGLAFTAGLLHDIGKSVISEFLVGNTEKMTELCEARKVQDYLEAERQIVGTDHSAVGHELAVHWSLPEILCNTIRDHHNPRNAPKEHQSLVYSVHLGDLIAMIGGSGTGSDSLAYTVDNGYEDYFAFTKDDLDHVLLKVEEDFETIKDILMSEGNGSS